MSNKEKVIIKRNVYEKATFLKQSGIGIYNATDCRDRTQIKQASAKLIKMTEESTLWIIKI